jgi:hypothetical protein
LPGNPGIVATAGHCDNSIPYGVAAEPLLLRMSPVVEIGLDRRVRGPEGSDDHGAELRC